jgi:outer membrane protein TolC
VSVSGSPPNKEGSWPLSLSDAIRIALDASEIVRVISPGVPAACATGQQESTTPIVIARLNADAGVWRFKAEVMAEVRSVEQQYWNLVQTRAQLKSAELAVNLTQDVLKERQAEFLVGRGTVADMAETTQRLEQLQLDVVTRTSDVTTTEQQLHNLLGLPKSFNRRIIPTTTPTEELIEYDWDTCLSQMMDEQPDIIQQRAIVRVAELFLLLNRNQLLPRSSINALDQLNGLDHQLDASQTAMGVGLLKSLKPPANDQDGHGEIDADLDDCRDFTHWTTGLFFRMTMSTRGPWFFSSRMAQYFLLRSRALQQQVIHQATHSLARFFLEVEARHKQFRQAQRVRAAAAERLEAQRAEYEHGCITIDRFLDVISQYANAMAQEAQHLSTYNMALAGLSEAKGTLLADRQITVAAGPRGFKTWHTATEKRDDRARLASFELDQLGNSGPTWLKPIPTSETGCDTKCCAPTTGTAHTRTPAKTWTFSIRIGGTKSFQVEGTVTVDEATQPSSRERDGK